jgi:hypothetical protein
VSAVPLSASPAGGTHPPARAGDASSQPHLARLRWGVRAVLTLGVAASVAANILHARQNPVSQTIAAWPPLALLVTVELISRVPVGRRLLSAARLSAAAGIAGIAAWVSYWHMTGVAARYGESHTSAMLLPLSVDGLIVVASISLVEISGRVRAPSPDRVEPLPAPVPVQPPSAASSVQPRGVTGGRQATPPVTWAPAPPPGSNGHTPAPSAAAGMHLVPPPATWHSDSPPPDPGPVATRPGPPRPQPPAPGGPSNGAAAAHNAAPTAAQAPGDAAPPAPARPDAIGPDPQAPIPPRPPGNRPDPLQALKGQAGDDAASGPEGAEDDVVPADTAAAVAYWRDRDPSLHPAQIAERIGKSERTVRRHLPATGNGHHPDRR